MKNAITVIILISTLSLKAEDQAFENKMNRIYKSSYSTEVNDQLWSEYITNLKTRTYNVSEGDTLWGLSEIFFGDGFFWSKIWSYNQRLTNPHLIKVGQEISFFTGSIEEPPSLSVNGSNFIMSENLETSDEFKSSDVDPSGQQNLMSGGGKISKMQKPSGLYPGAPHLPAPQSDIRPVLKNIPQSFVQSDDGYKSKYNAKGISLDIRPAVQVNPLFVASSFLYGEKADRYPRVGEIIESENGNHLVSLNDQLYIESKENFKQGEVLTIMGEDFVFDRNGISGSVIRYMARSQVVKKLPENRYLIEIVQSYSGVKRGAWISREIIPTFSDDSSGRSSDLTLKIIGGGSDNTSHIYGQSDIVYLSGGANKGLRVGDILGVYKVRDLRVADSKVRLSPAPIAHIKVFRAEPHLSSAFVIDSKEVMMPGDETGRPSTSDTHSKSEFFGGQAESSIEDNSNIK